MTKIDSAKKPFIKETVRYCDNCQDKTIWRYDPSIFHSRCIICGYMKVPIIK